MKDNFAPFRFPKNRGILYIDEILEGKRISSIDRREVIEVGVEG